MNYNRTKLLIPIFSKWAGVTLLVFSIFAVGYLHIPLVQNSLFSKLLKHLSDQTVYHFHHQQFRFTWLHKVRVEGLEITDENNHRICTISYLKFNINPFALFYTQNLIIHDLKIQEGKMHCVRKQGEEYYNVQRLLIRLIKDDHTAPKMVNYKGLTIRKALLDNCALWVHDDTKPYIVNFDPYHFQLESITIALSDLHLGGENWRGSIDKFAGYDVRRDLEIQHLQGNVTITPTAYLFHHVYIQTAYSYLRGHFSLEHQGLETLLADPYHAYITADIQTLQLDTQEISAWVPYLMGDNTIYKLKGKAEGKLNDLLVPDCQIAFGNSYLTGSGNLQNLGKIDMMHFSVAIHEGCLHVKDILHYIPEQYVGLLQKIQVCYLQTNCTGTLCSVVTQGQFETQIGKITTNLAIQRACSNASITYQGEVNTTEFELGKLLDLPELGSITLDAKVAGQGIDFATACAHITTKIHKLNFWSYNYQNIYANGDVGNMFFVADITIDDPHLVSNLNLKYNGRDFTKAIDVQGILRSAALDQLGLVPDPLQVNCKVSIALQGDKWTDLVGEAHLEDIHLSFNKQLLTSKEIAITTTKVANYHTFSLRSDFIDAEIEGSTTYITLINDLKIFINNYKNQLRCGNTLCAASHHPYSHTPYAFNYYFTCKKPDLLLPLLGVHIVTPTNTTTTLDGSFQNSNDEVGFKLSTSEIRGIQLGHHRLINSQLSLVTQHHKESSTISANGQVKLQAHQWKDNIITEQVFLDMQWMNDTIHLYSRVGNEKSLVQCSTHAIVNVAQTIWQLHLQDTNIRFGDEIWILDPKNAIQISQVAVECKDLIFTCQDQAITFASQMSNNSPKKLDIIIKNFLLNKLSPIADTELTGILQGTLNITNMPNQPNLQGYICVERASIAGLQLGDLSIQASWIDQKRHMQLKGILTKDQLDIITLSGVYMPYHATQKLDLIANFFQAPLAGLEPFIDPIVSQLQGELSGMLSIKGSLAKPLIKGKCTLEHGRLQFKHLKSIYEVKAAMRFLGDTMAVETLHLLDRNQGYVDFSGTVTYSTLANLHLDLKGQMHQVEVLNTEAVDYPHFYGTGIVSGDIHLEGLVQHLNIYANVITKRGTSLTIPVLKLNKIAEQQDFIRFVTLYPTQAPQPLLESEIGIPPLAADLHLHLNLEITPEARTKIICAGKNGDTIQAKGKGNLTIHFNINNTFHLSGNYELLEGDYSFTIYEVIKKKFKIVPGSTITWIDDIDDGMLHLKATYTQKTSLMPLIGHLVKNKNNKLDTLKVKYPIQVGVAITGSLAAPVINFDIQLLQLPQDPTLQEVITVFQEKIATDSDYLKTQVFSLIMFKKFAMSGENVLFDDNNTLFQRSLGELFSQQLNNLGAYISEDLEIETDIDNEETLQVPIKVSYNIWSDRLVISGESKIKLYDEQAMYFRDILDAWSLTYHLTSDKRIQIKLCGYPTGKKLNINLSKPIVGGISLLYKNSFNSWKLFFGRRE